MDHVHSFSKTERLCSRKALEALFASGNRSLTAFPLRVVFRASTSGSTQILVSVGKRHFKHAVDRNRAKRQIRAAWRLHRHILLGESPVPATSGLEDSAFTSATQTESTSTRLPLHIAFIWIADEPQSSQLIQRKMKSLLHRIAESNLQIASS